MAKSLFDEAVGDVKMEIDCPDCEKTFKISLNQRDTTVKCPHCGANIFLENDGNSLSGLEAEYDELEKILDSF